MVRPIAIFSADAWEIGFAHGCTNSVLIVRVAIDSVDTALDQHDCIISLSGVVGLVTPSFGLEICNKTLIGGVIQIRRPEHSIP